MSSSDLSMEVVETPDVRAMDTENGTKRKLQEDPSPPQTEKDAKRVRNGEEEEPEVTEPVAERPRRRSKKSKHP